MLSLDDWVAQVCDSLDLPAECVDSAMVLDLTRDVAHSVSRPAAPVTAYLAGLAVGCGAAPDQVRIAINMLLPPPTLEPPAG